MFQGKISISISGLSKGDCLPQSGWASSNLLQIYLEQKAEEKTDCSLPACLLEMDMNLLLSWVWNLDHQHLWFSGLQTWAGITLPVSSLVSPACRPLTVGLLSLQKSILHNKSIYLYISISMSISPYSICSISGKNSNTHIVHMLHVYVPAYL